MEDINEEIIWISQSDIESKIAKDSATDNDPPIPAPVEIPATTEDDIPVTKRVKLDKIEKSSCSGSQDQTFDKGCFDLEGANNCKKTQNHSTFISYAGFNVNNFPENFQDPLLAELVKVLGSLVVMLNISFASINRPKYFPGTPIKYPSSSKNGSGKIIFSERKKGTLSSHCPCRQCHQSQIRKLKPFKEWGEIKVVTAAHVVYDEKEAENTTCILNFNTEDRSGTQELKYLRTDQIDVMRDRSVIIFVTHNVDLAFSLMKTIYAYKILHENAYAKYESITKLPSSEYALNTDLKERNKVERLSCNEEKDKGDVRENSDNKKLGIKNNDQDKATISSAEKTNISNNNLAILISHPHGWSKKVSVGKFERKIHKTDVYKRREYTYYKYVLASCGGSSGAPVYILSKKNVWTHHPHSGSNDKNEGLSSIEFEKI